MDSKQNDSGLPQNPPEPTVFPETATGWRGFLARYRQQLIGFIGWYLIAWALTGLLSFWLFFVSLVALIFLALIKETRRLAGGILIALALNFVISLILGLGLNAFCFIPFFYPINF
jgi:hypothetical protein